MLKKLNLRKLNLFSRLIVLLMGMFLLAATAPLHAGAFLDTEGAETPSTDKINSSILYNNMLEYETEYNETGNGVSVQAGLESGLAIKDWWEIAGPDVAGMDITVVDKLENSDKPENPDKLEKSDKSDVVQPESAQSGTVQPGSNQSETVQPDTNQSDVIQLEPDRSETARAESAQSDSGQSEKAAESDKLPTLSASKTAGRTLNRLDAVNLSSGEKNALQRIVQAEAGNEDIMGKILVANVVLNRYRSEKFPNTIEAVVTQTSYGSYGLVYQFTPAKPGGGYWNAVPSEETVEAVERALNGEDYSEGALYFVSREKANSSHMSWFDQKLVWLFKHGNHEFYIG